jgi:hypothetical protein
MHLWNGMWKFFQWCDECECPAEAVPAARLAEFADWLRPRHTTSTSAAYLRAARALLQARDRLEGVPSEPRVALGLFLRSRRLFKPNEPACLAGLVMVSPWLLGTFDTAAISRFIGLSVREVKVYAQRLRDNDLWQAGGGFRDEWAEHDSMSFVVDAMTAAGQLVRKPTDPPTYFPAPEVEPEAVRGEHDPDQTEGGGAA